MKIYLGADHAGFKLKELTKVFLSEKDYAIEDCGAFEFNKDDDFPDFINKVAKKVSTDPENSRGILIGGSGQAEMMLANKYKNIRCALFYGPVMPISTVDIQGRKSENPYEIVKLTRLHNKANILSLGSRFLKTQDAITAIELWLKTPFSNDERHIRRIKKITDIESCNC
jgi:ribose 5-phosphate isomerase B